MFRSVLVGYLRKLLNDPFAIAENSTWFRCPKASISWKTLRMSRTFFIVIAVSLVFWLPSSVMGFIRDFCSCFSPVSTWFVTVLALGNSIVNPLVYSFRMPIFQDALKKLWRKRLQNNELRPVAGRSHISNFSLWIRCISGSDCIFTTLKKLIFPNPIGFFSQSLVFHPDKHTWQTERDPSNGSRNFYTKAMNH